MRQSLPGELNVVFFGCSALPSCRMREHPDDPGNIQPAVSATSRLTAFEQFSSTGRAIAPKNDRLPCRARTKRSRACHGSCQRDLLRTMASLLSSILAIKQPNPSCAAAGLAFFCGASGRTHQPEMHPRRGLPNRVPGQGRCRGPSTARELRAKAHQVRPHLLCIEPDGRKQPPPTPQPA